MGGLVVLEGAKLQVVHDKKEKKTSFATVLSQELKQLELECGTCG